jgi:RimJ/RimL family protein N-acetyltransferase
MDVQPITLAGRVARLEPIDQRHADDLAAAATPDLFTYHFPPPALTPEGFRAQIARSHERPNWMPFAIVLVETGRAVGVTAYLDIRAKDRGLEIGFTWLAKHLHGSLVNPECKFLLLRHAFERLGAVRVQLKTDSRNVQSQRAIEKLGAVREGVLRKHMVLPDGHVRDSVMYSITDDQWPEVREVLIARLGYEPD